MCSSDLAELIEDLGGQVAALLNQWEAGQPSEHLHAVTCLFSGDPSHAEAGAAWLAENTGEAGIEPEELSDLPGYRLMAEMIDRIEKEPAEES